MILWQWINQSYNAVFNYSNRNTSTESNNMDILKAYCSATVVSVGVALAGIPWFAVACAGAANVYLMRFKETRTGITVTDKDGNALGVSKKAGTKAVNLTALTRVILPTPGCFIVSL